MFKSFRFKLFVIFFLTTLIVSGLGIYLVYRAGIEAQLDALRRTVVGVATATALMIPVDKHMMVDPGEQKMSPLTNELDYILYQVTETNPDIKYVYTLIATDDPNICKFVLASEEYGLEEIDPNTVNYDVSQKPELRKGIAFVKPVATENFYTDEWGTWLSGYAPLKDKSGRTVAIVGADISVKRILGYQKTIKIWALGVLAVIFIISLLLSFLISSRITVPLVKITEHTRVISHGDFKKIDIEAKDEIRTLADAFNEMVDKLDQMFLDLNSAQLELKESYRDTIHRLAIAAEHKDKVTHDHLARVSNYSKFIAEEFGLSKDEVEEVYYGSPMHDIGKIGIPDEILLKKGKLTDEEYEVIKKHSEFGYKILKGSESPYLKAAALISHNHHEYFDGTGYPRKLKGKDIHIYGRIVAIADVFDALTSERPYKKAFSLEEAVEMIKEKSGSQFDPEIVEAFLKCLPRIEEYVKYVEWRSL